MPDCQIICDTNRLKKFIDNYKCLLSISGSSYAIIESQNPCVLVVENNALYSINYQGTWLYTKWPSEQNWYVSHRVVTS